MTRHERLNVPAVDCTGCTETILRALTRVDGVCGATADHLIGTVDVCVDDDVVRADLEATLRRVGYSSE